jgi:hypothetical protein
MILTKLRPRDAAWADAALSAMEPLVDGWLGGRRGWRDLVQDGCVSPWEPGGGFSDMSFDDGLLAPTDIEEALSVACRSPEDPDGEIAIGEDGVKAHIIDPQALRAISPLALSSYARAEKWVKEESFGDHSDVYVKPGVGEIIIPGTEALGDYVAVVSNLIERFAAVEGRNELQVYRDLVGSDRDVVRVRAPRAEADGSIQIDAGVDIVLHARDMLLSAACAAKDPRAAYRARKIKDAASYMDRVHLGQTEQGSFVVTLLAPVPPNLNQPEQIELWPSLAEEPFERLVTRRLSTALAAAQGAAERSIRGEGMDAFDAVVMSGVSANLCEALTNLIERGDGLEVSITWSKTRLAPEPR